MLSLRRFYPISQPLNPLFTPIKVTNFIEILYFKRLAIDYVGDNRVISQILGATILLDVII